MKDFLYSCLNALPMGKHQLLEYSPLALAFIGDAVYEVFIRTLLIREENVSAHNLHKKAVAFVKAKAQSDTIHRLEKYLSSEEMDMVRRGRNAKSNTVPKNADITDYRYATGFETLLGYLYLSGQIDRLMEILNKSLEICNDAD